MTRPPILGRWVRPNFPTREFTVCCTPLPGMVIYGWAYRDRDGDWIPRDVAQFREYDAVCRWLAHMFPQVDWEDPVCRAEAKRKAERA